jgi:hypothetical protein
MTKAEQREAAYTKRLVVRGVLDGKKLPEPVEVSVCAACGLGDHALTDVTRAFIAFGMHAY